jgi:hypothetical protein
MGYATVLLSIKKIKGLHENDFIMASKIDRMLDRERWWQIHSGKPVDAASRRAQAVAASNERIVTVFGGTGFLGSGICRLGSYWDRCGVH